MKTYLVHTVWVILIYVFAFLLIWGVVKAETKKPTMGCVIEAHHFKGKKIWTVWGHYTPPGFKAQKEPIGRHHKNLSKAAKACEEWMKKKLKILPIPLTVSPEKGGTTHAYK